VSHSPKVAKNQLLQSVDRLQAELAAEKQINAGGLNAVNWFTKQVDELRDRIALLKQENAALKASQVEPEITAALKTENAWLQAELKATQGRLESIQQLLSSPAATAAPIAPAPAPVLTAAPVPTHSADRRCSHRHPCPCCLHRQ
jgi:chromosome segregation ATPase